MAPLRSTLVPKDRPGFYHCVSRCVRRASLCGGQYKHRRTWIKEQLIFLGEIFAIDVGAYSVMKNHMHVLVRTSPTVALDWSAEEVVGRWLRLCPAQARDLAAARRIKDETELIRVLAEDEEKVEEWRGRLADLSWFMRCLKQPIARRANLEDGVTGHFWEGRFRSYPLLDLAALLMCLIYIDLNPIRAGIARTPEDSDFTSIQDRIRWRQRQLRSSQERDQTSGEVDLEKGIWLVPIQDGPDREGLCHLTLDEYLELVDTVGRQVRPDKLGHIPSGLLPILERLDIDAEKLGKWLRNGYGVGSAIGSAASLAAEAARRKRRWIVNAFRVYGESATT